jgi:hypothetical protein
MSVEQQAVIDQILVGLEPIVTLTQRGQAPLGPNVVAALDHGKPVYFEVADPLLYRSLVLLNRPFRGFVVQLLGAVKRIGQASVTLTPDFMAANFVRDPLMAFTMNQSGFRPWHALGGLKSRLLRDATYREYIANGGGFSSYLVDEHAFQRHLRRFYSSKGIGFRTVLDAPAKLLGGLERMTEAFEQATRLGVYARAKAAGAHPRHAAYRSREDSTDFGMRGGGLDRSHPAANFYDDAAAAAGFAYDTVLFLKAAVNGMDRLYRGLARDPNRAAIAAKAGAIALLSVGLYALVRDNPLYRDDTDDWDKWAHWHFLVPRPGWFDFVAREGGQPRTVEEAKDLYWHFRLPKIWEVGALASSAEQVYEGFLAQNPGESAQNIGKIVLKLMQLEWVPQAFEPLYEVAINENRFTERPIVSEGMQDLEPWARAAAYTSPSIRALSEATRDVPGLNKIAPVQIEALLRGYLNTWGAYGLSAVDGVFFDDMPDLRVDQYPVIRRFYSEHPARNTKAVREFYETLQDATQVRRTMREMDRAGRPELAMELEAKRENLLYRQLTKAQNRLRAINRELRLVHDASTLNALHAFAEERAKLLREPGLIRDLQTRGDWTDLGAMKSALRDVLILERNRFAKAVMEDVEGQKREPVPTGR